MSLAPVTCDPCEADLYSLPEETCSTAYKSGEISRLLIGKKGQPFVDYEDGTEHTTRQSQTDTGNDAIRNLRCIGSLTYAQGEKQENGTLGTTYGPMKMTLSVKVFDVTPETYQFIRSLGCNGELAVWPLTSFGWIIGGNEGVTGVLFGAPTFPEGFKDKVTFTVSMEKDVTIIPEVGTYPLDMNL